MSFGDLDSIHEVYIQVIPFSMGFSIFFTDVGRLCGVWALSVFFFLIFDCAGFSFPLGFLLVAVSGAAL